MTARAYPAHRLVAEYADGAALELDGFAWEQARAAAEAAQDEHGALVRCEGVTDAHYENGVFRGANQSPMPPDGPIPGQSSLFDL